VLSTYPLLGDGLLPMALATGPSPQSTSRHCSVNGGSPGMVLRSLGGWTAVHAAPQPPQPQRYRPRSLNAVAVRREHGRVDGVCGWRGRLLGPSPSSGLRKRNGEADGCAPPLLLPPPSPSSPACHVRRGQTHLEVSACRRAARIAGLVFGGRHRDAIQRACASQEVYVLVLPISRRSRRLTVGASSTLCDRSRSLTITHVSTGEVEKPPEREVADAAWTVPVLPDQPLVVHLDVDRWFAYLPTRWRHAVSLHSLWAAGLGCVCRGRG
jgi:hypothetical protein